MQFVKIKQPHLNIITVPNKTPSMSKMTCVTVEKLFFKLQLKRFIFVETPEWTAEHSEQQMIRIKTIS